MDTSMVSVFWDFFYDVVSILIRTGSVLFGVLVLRLFCYITLSPSSYKPYKDDLRMLQHLWMCVVWDPNYFDYFGNLNFDLA